MAKYWQNPPSLSKINGAQNFGFKKRRHIISINFNLILLVLQSCRMKFSSNKSSFVIKNCNKKDLKIRINGKIHHQKMILKLVEL